MARIEHAPAIGPARYATGKVVAICPSDGTGVKTRAMRLACALGGRWTNRSHGYVMSPSAGARLEQLWRDGWDAEIRMFADDKRRSKDLLIPPRAESSCAS